MKFSDFKNKILNKDISSIYLLEGEESYFSERAIELLKSSLLVEPSLNFNTLPSDAKAEEIVNSLSSVAIFDNYKITLIREFYPDEKFLKAGLKNFLLENQTGYIFVISNQKPCPTLKKIANVSVVECDKADPFTISRWVKDKCAKSAVEIDLESAKKMGEFCLFSMTRVSNETDKLIAYAGNGGKVTMADVLELVPRETEYKIYELTDFVGKGNLDKALVVINDMMSKGETFQRLTVSIYKYFSRLLHVAISTKSNSELASLLGVKEYAVVKAKEQAKLFKVKSLKRAVDLLSDSDYKIKSGILSESSAFYLSIFKILSKEGE